MCLLDRLDERETLYMIHFTKIYQKYFLYTKWNTIICETSMKMAISNFNESLKVLSIFSQNFLYTQNEQK